MNKGVACGTGVPCHINNEYQVLFYFNYVYMYICILFFSFPLIEIKVG